METLTLKSEYITLGQLLKAMNLVEDGVEAKYVIQDGQVEVNGEVDTRRGRKLRDGDVVNFNGAEVKVIG
ncbi:MAG: RNA-binding S4 domain-containing protein [Lachnospiraceae bacterium]|nr:RNA-binding S4 domain-containing protein [Candidatus Equihabitans merdae]